MTFIDATVKSLDERLAATTEQIARLEAARDILAGKSNADAEPTTSKRTGRTRPANGARQLTAKQQRALDLIAANPGISGAELSRQLGGTYGYQVVKTLRSIGQIEPCEGGGVQLKQPS